jgi:hypothetical protein
MDAFCRAATKFARAAMNLAHRDIQRAAVRQDLRPRAFVVVAARDS